MKNYRIPTVLLFSVAYFEQLSYNLNTIISLYHLPTTRTYFNILNFFDLLPYFNLLLTYLVLGWIVV